MRGRSAEAPGVLLSRWPFGSRHWPHVSHFGGRGSGLKFCWPQSGRRRGAACPSRPSSPSARPSRPASSRSPSWALSWVPAALGQADGARPRRRSGGEVSQSPLHACRSAWAGPWGRATWLHLGGAAPGQGIHRRVGGWLGPSSRWAHSRRSSEEASRGELVRCGIGQARVL